MRGYRARSTAACSPQAGDGVVARAGQLRLEGDAAGSARESRCDGSGSWERLHGPAAVPPPMSPVLCAIMTAATLAKGSKDWVSSMRRSIVVSHCVDHYPFRSRYGKRARRRGGSRPGRARATARPGHCPAGRCCHRLAAPGRQARPRDGPDCRPRRRAGGKSATFDFGLCESATSQPPQTPAPQNPKTRAKPDRDERVGGMEDVGDQQWAQVASLCERHLRLDVAWCAVEREAHAPA